MSSKAPLFGPFPKPRQHGAWAMFLIPALMAAALAGRWRWPTLLLLFAFVLIFLAHQPATKFLRRWKNRQVVDYPSLSWMLLLGGSGAALASALFILYGQWWALALGASVAVALAIHLWMTVNKEALSIPGELVGVVGLTAAAPIIYLFNHGSLDARGWVLWMINFLYFAGSIFYIKLKLRIQPSQPEPGLAGKIKAGTPLLIYSSVLFAYLFFAISIRGYSWLFLGAFVPFFLKAKLGIFTWQAKQQVRPTRTGVIELVHAFVFLTLALAAFHYSA